MDGAIGADRFQIVLGDGSNLWVCIRRNDRAKRLILRLDPKTGEAVVTCPPWVRIDEVQGFIASHEGWLQNRIDRLSDRIVLQDCAEIPYLGHPHVIRHRRDVRGGVWHEAERAEICVTGDPAHLPRRVTDWLKRQAKADLSRSVGLYTKQLGVQHGRITVRDTKSRWGSCAANGNLSFCWRLIFAPDFVRQYVAAHEVAHLLEHNHGPQFWRHVASLTDETEAAKAWLRRQGNKLHAIG